MTSYTTTDGPRGVGDAAVPVIEVRNLVKHYRLRRNWVRNRQIRTIKAIDGVSLSIQKAKTFGLVGESGCGKTTLGRVLLHLERTTSGEVLFEGEDWLGKHGTELRRARRNVQAVFQDPLGSLDPRYKVEDVIIEALDAHAIGADKAERRDRAVELLESVGLRSDIARRYPHELSGGQRQRVTIARAIAVGPKFLVCDEAVSALDVSVQAQVINLLDDLQESLGISYLFISHGLATVWHIADEIGVMYLGKLVEVAPAQQLFDNPMHPYTKALIKSAPVPIPGVAVEAQLRGEIPAATDLPSGCRFRMRCPLAESICAQTEPALVQFGDGHSVACHVAERSITQQVTWRRNDDQGRAPDMGARTSS